MSTVPWLLLLVALLVSRSSGLSGLSHEDSGQEVLRYEGEATEATIINDPGVYLVEVFSARCGSCQEFAKTWHKFVKKYRRSYKFAEVDIDTKVGMAYAKKVGALQTGIPAVLMFKGPSGAAPTALVKGEPLSYTSLKKEVIEASAGLERTLKGSYLKQNKEKDATEF
eukprot:CAMPEP_0174287188 /NCGR_PEP_ID=MMETSP0809-20121228/14785_1 /TAXON_ID=73025 ORGANISM="Eutreptiella gymnastica-like, Strain CCMP1594" /NCGR_SAMPLE_ID=MMETSP0809 /ASSEMBLY_ACC=CAM_ASM_000658 /LENGTH=167 /DNA_ID=CAMNT_0015383601 /DNA_START=19 /DNA_END=522 /DNA_ORIENTATION=+